MRFDTSNYKKKYDYGIYICSDRAFFCFSFRISAMATQAGNPSK